MKAIVSRDGTKVLSIVADDVPTRADVTREFIDESKSAPAFDAKTHKLEERIAIDSRRVTRSLVAVPLSADELSEAAAISEIDQVRAVLDALRAGAGTAGERLARIERVVGHICRTLFRS